MRKELSAISTVCLLAVAGLFFVACDGRQDRVAGVSQTPEAAKPDPKELGVIFQAAGTHKLVCQCECSSNDGTSREVQIFDTDIATVCSSMDRISCKLKNNTYGRLNSCGKTTAPVKSSANPGSDAGIVLEPTVEGSPEPSRPPVAGSPVTNSSR